MIHHTELKKQPKMNFLKNFDFISTEAKLTFNTQGDTRNKTNVGGFLSIFSIFCSIILSGYFFYEFICKNKKSLLSSLETSPNINFTESNGFPFMFRLTDPRNTPYPYSDSLYKIAMKYWYAGDKDDTHIIEQKTNDIKIEKCDINKHFGAYQSLFKNLTDLNTFYCAIPRDYNQSIHGVYGSTALFGYYHFYISMCLNQTEQDNCLEKDVIQSILSNTYLDIRTVDYSIDNNNLDKVAKPTIRYDRHMLSMTIYKRIWIYINKVSYKSDNGLIFTDYEEERFHQIDAFKYDIDMRDINKGTIPGTFATVTVLGSGNIVTYIRSFNKIQEYIATMGGVVHSVSVITYIINFYISKNYYYLRLIEEFILEKEINKHRKTLRQCFSNLKETNEDIKSINKNRVTKIMFKQISKTGKKGMDIKWYKMFLPSKLIFRSSRFVLGKFKFINDTLNIIQVMRCVEEHRVLVNINLKRKKENKLLNSNFPYSRLCNKLTMIDSANNKNSETNIYNHTIINESLNDNSVNMNNTYKKIDI